MIRMLMAGAMAIALNTAAPQSADLNRLSWLAGDWQMISGAQCIEEHWTGPSANQMIGMSRTVAGGRTVSFEFLRIEARADGVYYVAQPGGRPPVDFKLTTDLGPALVFANPGHSDHLKRILYTRRADDSVSARIEGENAGKPFAADFAYKRAANSAASRCGAVK